MQCHSEEGDERGILGCGFQKTDPVASVVAVAGPAAGGEIAGVAAAFGPDDRTELYGAVAADMAAPGRTVAVVYSLDFDVAGEVKHDAVAAVVYSDSIVAADADSMAAAVGADEAAGYHLSQPSRTLPSSGVPMPLPLDQDPIHRRLPSS
ncbi:unnamed protein product [Closterium sp. NIES-53]